MLFFTLTHDCAGCFTVRLGLQVVLCLLLHIWGWSMKVLVIFDIVMTPIKNWAVAPARSLPVA